MAIKEHKKLKALTPAVPDKDSCWRASIWPGGDTLPNCGQILHTYSCYCSQHNYTKFLQNIYYQGGRFFKTKNVQVKKKLQPNTTIALLSECLYEQLHDYLVLNKRIENKTQSAHDKKAKSILCLHFHIYLSNNNNIMLRSITDLHPLKQLLIWRPKAPTVLRENKQLFIDLYLHPILIQSSEFSSSWFFCCLQRVLCVVNNFRWGYFWFGAINVGKLQKCSRLDWLCSFLNVELKIKTLFITLH